MIGDFVFIPMTCAQKSQERAAGFVESTRIAAAIWVSDITNSSKVVKNDHRCMADINYIWTQKTILYTFKKEF